MIPIPTNIPWRTVAALTLGACLFGAGWIANGWRLGEQIQQIKATQAKEREGQATALAAASEAARFEEQRRTKAQTEIATNAKQEADQARADARAAAAVSDRLRQRIAELIASNSAAPTGGAPADTTDTLLAELFRRADERAGSLASDLDAARVAGQACERAYDALSAPYI